MRRAAATTPPAEAYFFQIAASALASIRLIVAMPALIGLVTLLRKEAIDCSLLVGAQPTGPPPAAVRNSPLRAILRSASIFLCPPTAVTSSGVHTCSLTRRAYSTES